MHPSSAHPATRRPSALHRAALAACLSLALPLATQAQTPPEVRRVAFAIPAQPLAQALTQYTEQTGRKVLFSEALVRGRNAPALYGSLNPQQALARLLDGSGLEAQEDADGALTLRETATARNAGTLQEVRVVATAEQELRQALGSSRITQEDLERRPPANDLAEILRTQPGVNLTGASSTGAYGNNRQIDLRGMGPENTMVLIDGKPVNSRDAAMMRRSGERDTHGDTNWVPADAIESVEIIRGPAAARYGSGAAGGVVNIVTKKPADKLTGSVTTYLSTPQHGDEGSGTQRLGFNLAGPISDRLSFRLYGNVAKTDANDPDINAAAGSTAAGIEGTRNRDVNGMLRWQLTPDQVLEFEAGISRQGNIYTGEYQSAPAPTRPPSPRSWPTPVPRCAAPTARPPRSRTAATGVRWASRA
ncbi:MAG: TonB-dependent receptor plug domain-containing protein [Pseudorhodoferax sp.]